MDQENHLLELRCRSCGWSEICGPEQIVRWLRKAGKLRANSTPEVQILYEVFQTAAPRMACPECDRLDLLVAPHRDDDADWPMAKVCGVCSQPIAKERLEAVPGATRCAACQRAEESGLAQSDQEYCSRCGSLMALRPSNARGVTSYILVCTGNPPCRR